MKKTMRLSFKIIGLILTGALALTLCSACGKEESEYYSSSSELAAKRISIWQGFTYEPYIMNLFPDAEYYYFGDINLMYEALKTNKVDAFAYEECFLEFAHNEGISVSYLEDLKYPTEYGFIFADSPKAATLQEEMNEFLSDAKKTGLLYSLQEEWMNGGETMGLNGLNEWDTSRGEIVISTTASQIPFNYIYEGQFSGYEAALIYEFGREYKYKLVINIVQWDAMIADVQQGRSDIGIGSIENSESHREAFKMSDSTYDGNFVLYVKSNPADEPKYTLSEINGLKAGILTGSMFETIIKEKFPDCPVDHYQTANEMIYAVSMGKADYTISQEALIKDACAKIDGITFLDEAIYTQHIGAIFNKTGEKPQRVLREFNEFIDELMSDGSLAAMDAKWKRNYETLDRPERSFEGETINIAINPGEIPYVFIKNGESTGMEIELLEAFCEKYHYVPQYFPMDFSGLITSVTSGKCDMAASNICITDERKQSVDFSRNYVDVPVYILVATKGKTSESFISSVKRSFERTFIEEDRYKMFLEGILTTLEITLASAIVGTALGFAVYILCRKGNRLLNGIFDVLARLMIGLPMVVVLMILYYVIFGSSTLPGSIIATVGFSVSIALSVYSELKVSVASVDHSQIEGAYSLGFTDSQSFFRIILPQAMQNFLPTYKGNIIGLINGTAVVGFIAVQDLTKMSDLVRARTYEAFFPLIATAVVYLVLGVLLTAIVKGIQFGFEPERRSEEKIRRKFEK